MRWMCLILTTMVLLSSACSDADLSQDDYNRACTQDQDCRAVLVGDMCACNCQYGAINASDYPAYQQDRNAINCGKSAEDCGACRTMQASCEDKLCTAKSP